MEWLEEMERGMARVRELFEGWADTFDLKEKFTTNQIDILFALRSMTEEDDNVQSGQLKSSKLCKSMTQSTYNRSLRGLIEQGYILEVSKSNGRYYLNPDKPFLDKENVPEETVEEIRSVLSQTLGR